MSDDAALMEASLVAVADSEIDIRHALFERFFAAFPARRPTFYNPDAASRRMTDETVQMMFGLATGERWVEHLVNEPVGTHRQYGPLPFAEYEAFVSMVVDALADAAGPSGWSGQCDAAWRRHGVQLLAMIDAARTGWDNALTL